jgi:hypothetical protein
MAFGNVADEDADAGAATKRGGMSRLLIQIATMNDFRRVTRVERLRETSP